MKAFQKYLFALAVAVYLLNSTGVPVYYHYCGGELESVNAVFKASTCCGGEEETEEDNGCCQNETQILSQKSENPFQSYQLKLAPSELQIFSVVSAVMLPAAEPGLSGSDRYFSYSRPPSCGRDILLATSVLII